MKILTNLLSLAKKNLIRIGICISLKSGIWIRIKTFWIRHTDKKDQSAEIFCEIKASVSLKSTLPEPRVQAQK